VPRLEALGIEAADCVEKLLREAFIVNVPHFKKGHGKLCAVSRICLASLILYCSMVAKECGGGNVLCTSLNQAARKADIYDSRFGAISREALLFKWSNIIANDLAVRRTSVSAVKPDFWVPLLLASLSSCQ
jgi:hypothetical protein